MDQNDNRPVFRQEVFTGQVLEGAVPGECQPPAPAASEVGSLEVGAGELRNPGVLLTEDLKNRYIASTTAGVSTGHFLQCEFKPHVFQSWRASADG